MTEESKYPQPQPGPVFYDVFLGYLRVLGTNLKDWCEPLGMNPTNAKLAATGGWNGPKARVLRQKMIETVGEETFARLYRERMAIENGRAA
jgi:hypothetical protein